MATTTRWGLPYPELTDAADVPDWMQQLAVALDNVAMDDQGALASRPVSTAPSPGKAGRYYRATDTGQLFRDHGTGWDEVPLNDVDADDLGSGLAATLGVNADGVVHRGKSIIATEESRTNAAYGLLATPDRVSGIVLPTDGLMFIAYQALWKNSVTIAGSAAVFLGANQLKGQYPTLPDAASVAAGGPGNAGFYNALVSTASGLISSDDGAVHHASDVTTGQVIGSVGVPKGGGIMAVFAAAGTYDVSVQLKASSGSVTAKERKLWVWTMGF